MLGLLFDSFAYYFMTEIFYLLQIEAVANKIYGLYLAVLAVLGGVDKRVRFGGVVLDNEERLGTVEKICSSGKIHVYLHENKKSCTQLLNQLTPVSLTFS